MYSVSSTFIQKMNELYTEHRLTGTIGSVQFTEENIVEGSFSISNQSTDTSDVVLGSCYVGELTAEFTGISINWSDWVGKVITPSFGLKIGPGANDWESVPLGVFKVAKATHTRAGVQVTAYDNMTKFDKKFKKSHFMGVSGMYNIINQICTDCGVTLGMTSAQIQALPNGTRTGINIYGSSGLKKDFANDIDTYRDLLFWCAQTLGCFATIDRTGQLVFRQYTQNVVENISDRNRIEGATFEDYITHYIGIYVENLDSNTEDYYGYDAAALQAEITETEGEITADNIRIGELDAELIAWKAKLDNHECTQEEYDAAVAEIDAELFPLQKEVKQLSKRLSWLQKAYAQSGQDGADMVLGANPLTMAKNLTTRDAQRREILEALAGISYTPFSASVICGAHYDLGDVIQFSGGLYNSATDTFGCVMAWTYTHNQGTELQGFGVDPAIVQVRNKTQKSTDRSERNAIETINNSGYTLQKIDDTTTPTPPAGMENNKVGIVTNKPSDNGKRTMEYWCWNTLRWDAPNWAVWRGLTLQAQIPFVVVECKRNNARRVEVDGKLREEKNIYLIGRWIGYAGSSLSQLPLEQDFEFIRGTRSKTDMEEIKPYFGNRFNNMYNIGVTSLEYWWCSMMSGSTAIGLIDEAVPADYKYDSLEAIATAINNGEIKIDETANTPSDNVTTLPSKKNAKKLSKALEGLNSTLSGNINDGSSDAEFFTGADIMSDENLEEIAEKITGIGTSISGNIKDVDSYYNGKSALVRKKLFDGSTAAVIDVPGLETTGKDPEDIGRDVNNNSLLFVMGDASGIELTKYSEDNWSATEPDFNATDFGYFSRMTGNRDSALTPNQYCTLKLEGLGVGVAHAMELTEQVLPYRHKQTYLMWVHRNVGGFEVVEVTVYCNKPWVLGAYKSSDSTYTFTYGGQTYTKYPYQLCFELSGTDDPEISITQNVIYHDEESDEYEIRWKSDPTHPRTGTYWYFEDNEQTVGLFDESFIDYLYTDKDALDADIENVVYDKNFTPGKPLGVLFSASATVSDIGNLPTDRGTWHSSDLFHSFYADGEEHTLTCSFTSAADVMYMHFIYNGLADNIDLQRAVAVIKGINDALMEYGIKRLYGRWGDRYYRYLDDEAGTRYYPDLDGKPQVNSVTLNGNKSTRDLGMIEECTQAEYDAKSSAEKLNPDKVFYIKDAGGGGGGGGGSTVVITPTLSEGTKIADYSIDGTAGELYAPTGGGAGYTRTELFKASDANAVWDGTNGITLSDGIENYDDIEIILGFTNASTDKARNAHRYGAQWFASTFAYVSAANANPHALLLMWLNQGFSAAWDSTNKKIMMWGRNGTAGIWAVYGIKY